MPDPLRRTVDLFKALGDPTRMQMLWLLMNRRELCVCDFMEVLQIPQSKASRHLRKLFDAGLVDDRRQGQWVYYALRKAQDKLIRSTLRGLRADLEQRSEAAQLLEALNRWLQAKVRATAAEGCK
jgi:ArsR family transcriptional regulator